MRNTPPIVLQVLPALGPGGVERGTVEMTQAIVRAGGTALVASAGGALVAAVEREGGRHFTLPLETKSPFGIWRNARPLQALIAAERVDLVHARSRAPAWSALLAARRARVPFVTTYHGVYGEDLPLKRHYNSVMAKGDRVIAATRFVADLIMARHAIDPARLRVIPRGVDPVAFDPDAVTAERISRLAQAWRLPAGFATVMLPGRLTRWKGQAVLIEALARLSRRDVCCVLVGADQGRHRYAGELVRAAEALGVIDRLRLVGHCDDMPAALMLSDVVVNASTDPEGFGRVVIEAQAMARPVIATDHGGAAETVEHGRTGWRVKPGDATALAAQIEQALSLPIAAREALGAQARQAVQMHYTSAAMQASTLEVYAELLG